MDGRGKIGKFLVVIGVMVMVWMAVGAWNLLHAEPVQAAKGEQVRVECERGAVVALLEDGRLRIVGVCKILNAGDEGPVRPDGEPETGPFYEYPYPVPDEPYPYIDNPCDRDWAYGVECQP